MPRPVVKFPKIDAANVASKLPEPLRQPAGAALRALLDFFGAEDPNQIMGTAAGVKIPNLGQELSSGLAHELMRRMKSIVLKSLYGPEDITSTAAASALSGLRGPTAFKPGIPRVWTMGDYKPWELHQARDEFYNLSQKALDELGVPGDALIDLYRTGQLPKSKYLLTPTHVDPQEALYWRHGQEGVPRGVQFEVPRTDIAGLVGLLRRGDNLTAGEVLVPSGVLQRATKMLPGGVKNPSELGGNDIEAVLQRIPGWFKKSPMPRK